MPGSRLPVPYIPLLDPRQGIVHIVGPEQGFTLPGTTIVCGDSHTSTHGAFGALAFGIGTSEVEHVLATQTLVKACPHVPHPCEGTCPGGSGPRTWSCTSSADRHGRRTGIALASRPGGARPVHGRAGTTPCRPWPWPSWPRGGTTASSSTSRPTTSTPRRVERLAAPVRMAGCNGCRQPRFRVRRRAGAGSGAPDARRHGGRLGEVPGTRQPGVRAASDSPSCSRSRKPRTCPGDGDRLEAHAQVETVRGGVGSGDGNMHARGSSLRRRHEEGLDKAPTGPTALVVGQDVDMQVGREAGQLGKEHPFRLPEYGQELLVDSGRRVGRLGVTVRQPREPAFPDGPHESGRVGRPEHVADSAPAVVEDQGQARLEAGPA